MSVQNARHLVLCTRCHTSEQLCPRPLRWNFIGYCTGEDLAHRRRLGDRLIEQYGGQRALKAMLWWLNTHSHDFRERIVDPFEFIMANELCWADSNRSLELFA